MLCVKLSAVWHQ